MTNLKSLKEIHLNIQESMLKERRKRIKRILSQKHERIIISPFEESIYRERRIRLNKLKRMNLLKAREYARKQKEINKQTLFINQDSFIEVNKMENNEFTSSECNNSVIMLPIKKEKVLELKLTKAIYTDEDVRELLNISVKRFENLPINPIKIGEASFSEVFSCNNLIYKIIPICPDFTQDEFRKEVFFLKTLCNEEGVARLEDAFMVQGKYSRTYLRAWDAYKGNENVRPDFYHKKSLFGVIVMENCGVDIEKYDFDSEFSIINFFKQISAILLNLERKYEFEHRDMHWGNVLIRDKQVNLIDFSLSRLRKDGKVIYTDLNKKEWLFEGNSEEDIQFECYKSMRKLSHSDWYEFSQSNLIWLVYLANKLKSKYPMYNLSCIVDILSNCNSIEEACIRLFNLS